MFIIPLRNGNFAVAESYDNGIKVLAECESYDAASEMINEMEV